MAFSSSSRKRPANRQDRNHERSHVLYDAQCLVATIDSGSVAVEISIGQGPNTLAILEKALTAAAPMGIKPTKEALELLAVTFEKVAECYLRDALSTEFDRLISEYRVMLRESLATGDNAPLKAALNRARIQERLLAATPMADQGEACELLGLSGSNPSATMKRKEEKNEVLRFTIDGRAAYPLFQFDVENRRIFPALSEIITRKPVQWSNFRLLHWLTREHLDFEDTPSAALGSAPEAVIAAFEREIEPQLHG